jgi:RHS repeat-associated protein
VSDGPSEGPAAGTGSSSAAQYAPPKLSLPKGGGALRGIGEKFSASSATGAASLTIPIPTSPGRQGFGPSLSVDYNSGQGNGPFGIGWELALPRVTRKTDKGLPTYGEIDVFILSGSEDLVPVLREAGEGKWVADEFFRDGYLVRRYRPRIEGLFAIVECWTARCDGSQHWRTISKDNVLTVYGRTANSRIADPEDSNRVFSWLICESFDDRGNAVVYEYREENGEGVDPFEPFEQRRERKANRYLKAVRYGNRRPLLLDPTTESFRPNCANFDADLAEPDWMFSVVFDYGDERIERREDDEGDAFLRLEGSQPWTRRADPFSSYRSAFEIRSHRLCRRASLFHHFPEELGVESCLVKAVEFEYDERPSGTLLIRSSQFGYSRVAGEEYLERAHPPLDLYYTSSPLEDERNPRFEIQDVPQETLDHLPNGVDGDRYRWIDLDGEGIPGVLGTQGPAWYYSPNRGEGRLAKAVLEGTAHGGRVDRQVLMDIAGDGNQDLVDLSAGRPGYHERVDFEGWGAYHPFQSVPNRGQGSSNLRFVDVTGDGLTDIVITEDLGITWYRSRSHEGYGPAVRIPAPHDDMEGPLVLFSDPTVALADMTGDGLADIVRIRQGEICYWPNLGYGRFGRKVTMGNAPWFEEENLFDPSRIHIADTDGSGVADILYLGRDGIQIHLNQSGNWFHDPVVLRDFPIGPERTVSVIDLLGRGTACVVWSSSLPHDASGPLRYIDLMRGVKPWLLAHIVNNMGAETALEYGTSTEFYLQDLAEGSPWVTRLPFPVHVVKKIEVYDFISRNRFVTRKSYHHGYFNGLEREFRGFGRVDQWDAEEIGALTVSGNFPASVNEETVSNVPPVLTKTWFHTGVFMGQDRVSRHLAHEYYTEPGPASERTPDLPDSRLPENLPPEEEEEACRALKGSMIRQEVYALDCSEASTRPYVVTEGNFTIRLVQRRFGNKYGVFFSHPRETSNLEYDRRLYEINGERRADPRVSQGLTLEVDEFGNVLNSVNVAYGRRYPELDLPEVDRREQAKTHIVLTSSDFTSPVFEPDAYRAPSPAESRQYEILGASFAVVLPLRLAKAIEIISALGNGRHDLPFEWQGPVPEEREVYRRLFKRSRTIYRDSDLKGLLPLGRQQPLDLPGESYELVFTPGLIRDVYRRDDVELVPDADLIFPTELGLIDLDGDGHWWARSGQIFYSPAGDDDPMQELAIALRHFFVARRFVDPFGNISHVSYDSYDLLPIEMRDPVGNVTRSKQNYRVLSPERVTDPNGNRSEVAFDALAMVVGMAVGGKEGENQGESLEEFRADLSETEILAAMTMPVERSHALLGGATSRFIYDLFAYCRLSQKDRTSMPQTSRSVCGDRSFGPAEPDLHSLCGRARPDSPGHFKPVVTYSLVREDHEQDLAAGQVTRIQRNYEYSDGFGRSVQGKKEAETRPGQSGPTWTVTGWTIFNNKGKPVRQYEQFFSRTQEFEFAPRIGVSPILCYDPMDRLVATLKPNHTFEKTVLEPWKSVSFDENDTVLEDDPARDPDVGRYFELLPPEDYLPTWYQIMASGQRGKQKQRAAQNASIHANTPNVNYFDSLGRTFRSSSENRFERDGEVFTEEVTTRTELDIKSNTLAIIDPLKRAVVRNVFSVTGSQIRQKSIDSGERWSLEDVSGQICRSWDARGFRIRKDYDGLRRLLEVHVSLDGAVEWLAEKVEYGESVPDAVERNLRSRSYRQFDESGQSTSELYDFKGNLTQAYKQFLVNPCQEVNWFSDPALIPREYRTTVRFDALNRLIVQVTPDGSVLKPEFDQDNRLRSMTLGRTESADETRFVDLISYNARGQRESIRYGNGAWTRFEYEPETFRLQSLKTRRQQQPAELQSLTYTYDPVGNVAAVSDHAQEAIFFEGHVASPLKRYVYDALYRLIEADGRERASRTESDFGPETTNPQAASIPSSGTAVRAFTEEYHYDLAGNLLTTRHRAKDGNWTRRYRYGNGQSNRLTRTSVGDAHLDYGYDANGNMAEIPHLSLVEWGFKNQLRASSTQIRSDRAPDTTYYTYDVTGARARKAAMYEDGSTKSDRLYIGVLEIYRKYGVDGEVLLEREAINIMDGSRRLALVETLTKDRECADTPQSTTRYQFSDHLGSATIEVDGQASVLTYEEYTPFGSTAFRSGVSAAEVSLKRYRYLGKEHDEETGLYSMDVRYYAAWLGRWTSCDPIGVGGGLNAYVYAKNNPIALLDRSGADCDPTMATCVDTPPVAPTDAGQDLTCNAEQVCQDDSAPQADSGSSQGAPNSNGPNVAGAGYGLIYASPKGFTLSTSDSSDLQKLYELKKGVMEGEIGRNAGPESPTGPRRNSRIQRDARAEFERNNPRPDYPPPEGGFWSKDHLRPLQYDLTGTHGNSPFDYRWKGGISNSAEGRTDWQFQKDNAFMEPAGGVVPAAEAGFWYNMPEFRDTVRGGGNLLTAYAIYQSSSHVVSAVQADIQQGTAGAQTAQAVAHEAGGWAGAMAGAETCAPAGAFCGPFAWICTPVAGLVCGGVGYWVGSSVADESIEVGKSIIEPLTIRYRH